MGGNNNSSDKSFQSNEDARPSDTNIDGSSGRAGIAQKSARAKKSPSAFLTISEVADSLDVQQHVLRFWETKFSQIKPLKRGGGRRYYRPEDVLLLKAVHRLLYVEGYTIKGVQKLIRDVGKKQIVASFSDEAVQDKTPSSDLETSESKNSNHDKHRRETLEKVLLELKEIRGMIKSRV